MKCNFDASLNAGAQLIGIGFVHNGVFVEARNGSIHGEMDAFSFHAEAIGCIFTFDLLKKKNYTSVL